MRYLTVALVLALLVAQVAQAELPRHTPGFPDVGSWQWLEEVLRDPKLLEALRALGGAELSYRELLESLIPREALPVDEAGGLSTPLGKDLEDLVAELGDPKLKALVEGIESGEMSQEELARVLEHLESLRASGALDLSSYVAFLVGLADTLRERNLEVPPELLSRLGTALADLLNILQLGRAPQLAGAPTNPEPSLPRPEFRAPAVGLQLPTLSVPWLPLDYVLVALAAIAAVALALRAGTPRLPKLGLSRVRPSTAPTGAEEVGEPDAVRLYWRAVELVSKATGIPREDHVTHREYLARLKALAIEPLLSSFSALTQAYELYRYGGVRSESVVEVARRAYTRVVESLGRL